MKLKNLLFSLLVAVFLAQPALAEPMTKAEMAFAFKDTPEIPYDAGVEPLSEQEERETGGAWLQYVFQGGRYVWQLVRSGGSTAARGGAQAVQRAQPHLQQATKYREQATKFAEKATRAEAKGNLKQAEHFRRKADEFTAKAAQSTQKARETIKSVRTKKVEPIRDADGPHTTWKIDPQTGQITRHETWTPNPRNPSGWDKVQSTDLRGAAHINRQTGEAIPTPHTQGTGIPGGVRPATPIEIPRGIYYNY